MALPDFKDYLSNGLDLEEVGPVSYPSFEAMLFYSSTAPRQPPWADFLAHGLRTDIDWPLGSSTSALLILRTAPRDRPQYFAFAFGSSGRFFLRDDSYHRAYGLKAALNLMYPTGVVTPGARGLRTVGSKRHGATLVRARAQSSSVTTFEAFDIDHLRDLVWEVDGRPADPVKWGPRVAGGDAFVVTHDDVEFADLGDLCRDIDVVANLTDYRVQFAWLDYIQPVTDPTLIEKLRGRVIELVRTDGGELHLAPPTIVDWSRINRFQYPFDTRKKILHQDLRLQDLQAVLRREHKLDDIDFDGLHDRRLMVLDVDGQRSYRWTLWSCLTGEMDFAGQTYVLDEGAFYEVQPDYLLRLNQWIDAIPHSLVDLPDHRPSDREEVYNERSADAKGYLLLDQRNVQVPGTTAIELCDLLTRERAFVHVKKNSGSRDLSHLFSQGVVSATLLQDDSDFRELSGQRVREIAGGDDFDFFAGGWDPRSVEVVFAIIDPRWGEGASKVLPFFSKVNLQRSVRELQSRGYIVRLGPIGVSAIA